MPRSFLVKKCFVSKKPNYTEREIQNVTLGAVEARTVGLVWDLTLLPGPILSPPPGAPRDPSGSYSSEEEEECRSSDSPSPNLGRRGSRTLRCKQCSAELHSLGALKVHLRSHPLPCVCPACGKAFSRPWLLRGHIRTHTGERPFSCSHCSRAFADRSNLRAHLQTHEGASRHRCNACERTFSRGALLQKHARVCGQGPL